MSGERIDDKMPDIVKAGREQRAAARRRAEIAAEQPVKSSAPQSEGEPTRSEVEALVEKLEGLHTKTCSRAALMISQLAIGRAVSRTRIAEMEADLQAAGRMFHHYADHDDRCSFYNGHPEDERLCDCGYDMAAAALTPGVASAKAEEG